MPQLIQHIDKIAREKQRDVLFLGINLYSSQEEADQAVDSPFIKPKAEAWLTEQKIPHRSCLLVATDEPSLGQTANHIYIDVPMDESNPAYQKLIKHFETEEGLPKDPRCVLYFHTLEDALKNAHHDEPGYWENWAKNF